MVVEIVVLICRTVGGLLISLCLLRLWLQYARAASSNPIATFTRTLTDWLVLPLRKVIPSVGALDMASLCGAWLVGWVLAVVMRFLLVIDSGLGLDIASLLIGALVQSVFLVVENSLMLCLILVIGQALISWINPHAPVAPVLNQLANPVLAPVRRVLPRIGQLDLSPLVVILLLQILNLVVSRAAMSVGLF